MIPCISNSKLAVITYFAKIHAGDVCGNNGLPLTLNSIAILGQSELLKTLNHPNLCQYLDILRGKHERTIIVSEYVGTPLSNILFNTLSLDVILKIFYQVADGLNYIHNKGFVNNNLEPANILLDNFNNIKLFNYGLFHMTNKGKYVPFPIGNVKYMSPERILGSKNNNKSDSWSLGIIISEILFQCKFWPTFKISQLMRKIISFYNTQNVLEKIARENNCIEKYKNMDESLRLLLESCLNTTVKNRPTPYDIINCDFFKTNLDKVQFTIKNELSETSSLISFPLKVIYYWWQLAGGSVQTELKKEGLIRSEAPILTLPRIIMLNGKSITSNENQNSIFDNRIVMLKLTNLIERLSKIKNYGYFPLIHYPKFSDSFNCGIESLPLIIREKDTEYQYHRTILFTRLLKGYPFTRDIIIHEAQNDIPPILRGHIWACILGVIEDGSYEKIDKFTATPTDRQIEVDIPRCHQYDELLSSPEGHRKLKRILKAWVTSHPQYVYWQGLDSLTAPFIYLNFTNEERAFLSLYKFIPKYLHWFFLKDNSAVIKEYLYKFSQLTAFHEPILAKHLKEIHFIPELFAIPWFLTMFSHVFPLHKIIHLWDKLILGDNSFPLFIGISILRQLKSTLLSSGFNECILLFSDLPDIVMEICVIESQKMYLTTPKSVCYRKYVERNYKLNEFDINDIELNILEKEMCPRISANNLIELLNEPEKIAIIDLRSNSEFSRAHIKDSINIPFTSVLLGDTNLLSLKVNNLEKKLYNRIVIIVSIAHENSVLFSKFLIDCGVSRVCMLHNGFNILNSINPCIFESSI